VDRKFPQELFTVKELAKWLKITPTQVLQLTEARKIPALIIPGLGHYRFDPDAVLAFLKGETPEQRAIRAARALK